MRTGIRGKLFLISLGLIAGALLVSDLVLTSSLDKTLTARTRADLLVRTGLAEREATRLAEATTPPADPEMKGGTARSLRPPFDPHAMSKQSLATTSAWQTLATELAKRAQARLTFISTEGQVLGDSELDSRGVLGIENHHERPEVLEALAKGQGTGVRFSSTLGQRMMYVAVPFHQRGRVAGVVRAALPLAQVDQAIAHLRMLLLAASLLALILAGLVATLATRRISLTLRRLAQTAGRMVEGELGERARTPGHDEIATLGKSLDRLADSLSTALTQLKTERDLLGGILADMQEGVLVLDRESRLAHANPALRSMLLLDSDCLGRPLLEVIRNVELVELLARARNSACAAQGEVELTGLKPRRLMVQVSHLRDDPGDLLVVLVDVTLLRQLESLRKDFVANASHELRTPVASMRSAAETLRGAMEEDPEAAKGFLEIIERNATRLHHLVEDLLDLSRIESREFRMQLETLELGAFADQMAAIYDRPAKEKGIQMEAVPGARDLLARADRRALEQVLGNLLDNAINYCPRGATVRIHSECQGDRVRVIVSDTGPGIPAQHLPRIFERFYRVDAGRSRELGGTGLGLAIVKHLVEAMGGAVAVESEAGQGTTFSFTLPKG